MDRPQQRAAHVLGVTPSIVRKTVCRSLPTPPTPTRATGQADSFTIGAIRRHIHGKFDRKEYMTTAQLTEELINAGILPEETSMTSVWRMLHQMGFKYKVARSKLYVRKESMEMVCRRAKALRTLKQLRDAGREPVYIDETWFTTRMNHSMEWVDGMESETSPHYSRQVPPGDGERLVVLAAGTDRGFVEGSYLSFRTTGSSGDYHGAVNSPLFMRWLTEQLLPSLERPSVIIMDNAPYHSVRTDESRCPTTASKKADLVNWLLQRGVAFPPNATRAELLALCKERCPEPEYIVDRTIREWGHEVVRLPPGHPELNAIEQIWGTMKHHVRSSLQRFTRTDLQDRLEEARRLVDGDVWSAAVRRAKAFEDDYWRTDNVPDAIAPVIIPLDDEDDSDDEFCYDLGSDE